MANGITSSCLPCAGTSAAGISTPSPRMSRRRGSASDPRPGWSRARISPAAFAISAFWRRGSTGRSARNSSSRSGASGAVGLGPPVRHLGAGPGPASGTAAGRSPHRAEAEDRPGHPRRRPCLLGARAQHLGIRRGPAGGAVAGTRHRDPGRAEARPGDPPFRAGRGGRLRGALRAERRPRGHDAVSVAESPRGGAGTALHLSGPAKDPP